MMKKLSLALVAVALTVPAFAIAAVPSWTTGDSQHEPSTSQDDAWQWPTSPKEKTAKVYFNVWQSNFVTGVGAVGTGFIGNYKVGYAYWGRFYGQLGYWRDCNGDNYVGDKVLGRDFYPVARLDAAGLARCPATGANTLLSPVTSFDQRFNDGVLVHEFVAIGYKNEVANGITGATGDRRDIEDATARVWVDYGLVTDTAFSDVLLAPPFPRNTLRDGNSLLGYVNYLQFCNNPDVPSAPVKVCFGSTATPGPTVVVLPTLPANVNEQTKVLWTVKQKYNDSEHHDDWGSFIVDPRDGDTCNLNGDPTSWETNQGGSIAPTVNAFGHIVLTGHGECVHENEVLISNLEIDDSFDTSAAAGGKTIPDVGLAFGGTGRYDLSQSALRTTPAGIYTNVGTGSGASYAGSYSRIRNTPLECDTLSFGCKLYFTGYAKIGQASLDAAGKTASEVLKTGATSLGASKYGSEICNQATQLPHTPKAGFPGISSNNWNCSRAAWQAVYNAQDPGIAQWYGLLYDGYDLRDVDCMDGSIGTHIEARVTTVSLGPAAGARPTQLATPYAACTL